MKYSYIALVLVAFYSLTSCVKNTLIQTEEELSVEAQKWKSFGFSDYDYTLEIICFCPIEYTKPNEFPYVIIKLSQYRITPKTCLLILPS